MTVRSWSPPLGLTGFAWLLALAAAAFALFTDDRPGQLLVGAAGIALLVMALHGTVARPRLYADGTGVVLRGLAGARRWTWPDADIRLVETRRFGRTVTLLEVMGRDEDGTEHLVLMGRLELGAEPIEAATELLDLKAGQLDN
jgi:hypothetical protein